MSKINFRTGDRPFVFKNKTGLKYFIGSIFKKEKQELERINYIFCSDDMLLKINQDFLQHNYYTDIITFGLNEPGEPIEAEIYVSIDRVKDNAIQHGVSYENEMQRVLFHGALHLCGYKDKKKSEIILMRQKEDQYLLLITKAKE
ncbi:MAG TPA: rRNA maturation RNase YbeY [Sediminibacterium sp.]|uniref:rRNA maturation RNase YbeY n=1 Tax=Sediminibacterium sp. TaxID=1917865 RepID=UPI0008C03E90|nr:rRNA maturation RNase YbeY [Sediminibacterium sp.]OHC86317.1 MAG: rRNA maturation RNase YbeY [Sphingobacteriia bacterium RIFOXYC2_FULL_35_18]OHC89829.1 MAG: rRNA maturation RNase YbeY [Sphingobacteriia bacterium RIFOXYD2_FULL_35_12]HLD54268.1 rRNA maturation RNase YbeY [Sediminibacterium sp.]